MIELKNVSKFYGTTRALDNVSFNVRKGEIIGFVGPNGAGKTTAMKIITTYTAPTQGSVSVAGVDVMEDPITVRRSIGYLPETVPLYNDMLVAEYLDFIGEARHLNGSYRQRRDWVINACGLEPVLDRKIGVLSKGFKQRTCLAQALIHDPDVLILDEPTSGLDPLQIIGIRNLIRELAESKTIVLSTHILPEVATIADRILVISSGRIVGNGSFEELRRKVTRYASVSFQVKASKKEVTAAVEGIEGLAGIEYDAGTPRGVTGCHLSVDPGRDIVSEVNALIRENGWTILDFQRDKLSLEESFIRLTRPDESGGAGEQGKGGDQ